MRLKGKVAIVTGSARNPSMGRSYALQFAKEGAKIVVCDLLDCGETAKEIESMGGEVLSLRTDVSSEESTIEMAEKISERFGRIDVLVNNAALYADLVFKPFYEFTVEEWDKLMAVNLRVFKPFYEFTVEEWDKLMAVNLRGMFLCCKAVFPFMKAQGKGKIVNITSTVAFEGIPGFIHYATSKGGVISFTRAMARELGDYNINVNAVAPGLAVTKASTHSAAFYDQMAAMRCFKRREHPEDMVGAVTFLCSEESDFITGQTIVVDGGCTLH